MADKITECHFHVSFLESEEKKKKKKEKKKKKLTQCRLVPDPSMLQYMRLNQRTPGRDQQLHLRPISRIYNVHIRKKKFQGLKILCPMETLHMNNAWAIITVAMT